MRRIKRLKNRHYPETCVIIGNGPSLKDVDLPLLSQKYHTFGSNKIYLYPFTPTYYAVADPLMLEACKDRILEDDFTPIEMFLPNTFQHPKAVPINYTIKHWFSRDPVKELVVGGTVTYVLLQLAFYMGFQKALLVGVDHNYPGAGEGEPGQAFVQEGKDPDHFHPDYFTEGEVYNRPELDGTAMMYEYAKNVWEADGRKIVNLTSNSRLMVYDRDNLKNYI